MSYRSPRSRPRMLLRLFSLVLLVAPFPRLAFAVERNNGDEPVSPFHIAETGGEVGIQLDYLSEEQSHENEDSVKFVNRSLESYLLQRFRGYVYHPRFLDFRGNYKLGWLMQRIDRSGLTLDDHGGADSNTALLGYDLYLRFLKDHPVSISLFSRRDRDAVRRLFTDRFLIDTESWGAIINWKNKRFPMDFSYTDRRLRERGSDSRSESRTRTFEYTLRNNFRDRIRTELRYRYQGFNQLFRVNTENIEVDNETKLRSHDVSLQNTVYLNPERTNYLLSSLRWFDQSGSQEFGNFYWREQLHLRHTPNFRTYYLVNYLRNEVRNSTIETFSGESGLEYQLYKSLEAHFDVHGRRSAFDDLTDSEYGITGQLNYRKETPWGYLTAGYGRTVDWAERTGASSRRTIVDESLDLSLDTTQFLSKPGVVSGSITVTDVSSLITYIPNFDYVVERRGNRTGLRILSGGQISEGDTVLVDYDVEFTSDLSYTSIDQQFHVRYDLEKYLKGLALYYRWHDLSTDGVSLDDDLSILEFTYNWRWLTWREEYQSYDSNFTRFTQIQSQLEGAHRIGPSLRLGWHAGVLNVNFDDEFLSEGEDFTRALYAGTNLRGAVARLGYWELQASGRKETGVIEETLMGILGKVGLRWRKMRMEAGARYEQRDRFESDRQDLHLFFQVAREF